MRPLNEIIVHCTATRSEWWAGRLTADKVAEVRKWHLDRNFRDIGYHFLIERDGTVATGRPLEQVGAHVAGHNTGTIGISLFGGHGGATTDKFEDNFTPEQDAALRNLIANLQNRFPSISKISGHHEYANKACPCFDVRSWLNGRTAPVRTSPAQSTTVQASAAQIGTAVAGGATALAALDGTAQIVAMVVVGIMGLAAVWIMRERLKKWSKGDR